MSTHIVKKAIITEQSLKDASKGVFTFEVGLKSSKTQIKQVVEDTYNVSVVTVRTNVVSADRYRVGKSRREVLGTNTKKARVKLKSGQRIDLFEVGEAV